MMTRSGWAFVAAVSVAGCESGAVAPRAESLEEAPTPTVPAGPETIAPGTSTETIGPPAHAAIPDWVPASLREGVEASRLPVMLPREPAIASQALATAQVLSMDRWVSTRIETSTSIVTIFGTDAHHEPPRGAAFEVPSPDRTIRGASGYAYENEGLFYAQWSEGGVAWEVEVECLGSCDGVGLATQIAESLEAVGGVR
ncbi:MAG: hypothetical protein K1X94_16530 [Sandaracinaceae bacterium]|nr:hypothetical protein [Sandaracinaceae bacterium]